MKRIGEIDGLRACAALLVIAWHYIGIPDGPKYWLWNLFYLGAFGVDLFFVLSGFLIATILIENGKSPNYFSTFYGRRALRIWPLYYVLCFACFLGWLSGKAPELFQSIVPGWTYILGIQNFWMAKLQDYGFPWLGGTWSLAIEEQFYLVFPLISRKTPSPILPRLLLVFIVVSDIGRVFAALIGDQWGYYVLPQFRLDSLSIGALIAWWRIHGDRKNVKTLQNMQRLLMISACCLPFICLTGSDAFHAAAWQHSLASLFFGALLFYVLENQGLRSLRWLRGSAARFFAHTSYAAYLTHGIVATIIFNTLGVERTLRSFSGASVTVLAFVATFVLCEVSYRSLERPLIRLGHRRFRYDSAAELRDIPNQRPHE